jgi:hypothetical protein
MNMVDGVDLRDVTTLLTEVGYDLTSPISAILERYGLEGKLRARALEQLGPHMDKPLHEFMVWRTTTEEGKALEDLLNWEFARFNPFEALLGIYEHLVAETVKSSAT